MATINPVEMAAGEFVNWAVETYGVDYDQICFAEMLRSMDSKIAEQPEGDAGFPAELVEILYARKGQTPPVVETPEVEPAADAPDARPVNLRQFFGRNQYDIEALRTEQAAQAARLANSTPIAGYRNQYQPDDGGSVFEAYAYGAAIARATELNRQGHEPGPTAFVSEWVVRGSRTGE